MGKTCTCNQEKPKSKQASANLPYLPTRCEARTGLGGWESSQSQNAELSMQVREPRMDDNRASAADNLRKISPSCVGSEKFFLHCCLVRKIQFSSLSLRSANENYYFLAILTLWASTETQNFVRPHVSNFLSKYWCFCFDKLINWKSCSWRSSLWNCTAKACHMAKLWHFEWGQVRHELFWRKTGRSFLVPREATKPILFRVDC